MYILGILMIEVPQISSFRKHIHHIIIKKGMYMYPGSSQLFNVVHKSRGAWLKLSYK